MAGCPPEFLSTLPASGDPCPWSQTQCLRVTAEQLRGGCGALSGHTLREPCGIWAHQDPKQGRAVPPLARPTIPLFQACLDPDAMGPPRMQCGTGGSCDCSSGPSLKPGSPVRRRDTGIRCARSTGDKQELSLETPGEKWTSYRQDPWDLSNSPSQGPSCNPKPTGPGCHQDHCHSFLPLLSTFQPCGLEQERGDGQKRQKLERQ